MKTLTATNQALLQALCLEMGIEGEVDASGNVYKKGEQTISEPKEKTIFGFTYTGSTRTKIEKKILVTTLQEIVSMRLGLEYDPNDIVRGMVAKMIDG